MKRHIPESHTAHPNVTPLIDIVMCLIIFFMLVARIGVNTGADESIVIPATVLGSKIEDMGNTLLLNVRPGIGANDQPQVSGLIGGQGGEQPAVQEIKVVDPNTGRRQLADVLKFYRYGTDLKPGGDGPAADNDEFKVILRVEEGLPFRQLQPVLEANTEAGVPGIAYETATVTEAAPAA